MATVTLCRPAARNALGPAQWDRLREIGRTLTGAVRVVVVRAEGPAFSAGLDRSVADALAAELAGADAEAAADRLAGFQAAYDWLRRPDLVSVLAVRGPALGAGCQLALAGDLRVLADDAQLALPELSLGLVPDLGGTKALVELVGYARALEICATGRWLGAAEAERLGLANLVVPAGDLDAAVADLTAALLAAPRDALVEVKALLAAAAGRTAAEHARAEREAQLRLLRDRL